MKMSAVLLDKVSASPTLKLPQLFSLTPNSSGKGGNMPKRNTLAQTNQMENFSERKSLEPPRASNQMENIPQGCCICPAPCFMSIDNDQLIGFLKPFYFTNQ